MRNIHQTTRAWIAKFRAAANLCCLQRGAMREMTQPFTLNSKLNASNTMRNSKNMLQCFNNWKNVTTAALGVKNNVGASQCHFFQAIKSFRSCFLLHWAKSNKRLSSTWLELYVSNWLGRSVNHVKQTDSSNERRCWLREKSIDG